MTLPYDPRVSGSGIGGVEKPQSLSVSGLDEEVPFSPKPPHAYLGFVWCGVSRKRPRVSGLDKGGWGGGAARAYAWVGQRRFLPHPRTRGAVAPQDLRVSGSLGLPRPESSWAPLLRVSGRGEGTPCVRRLGGGGSPRGLRVSGPNPPLSFCLRVSGPVE